MSEGADDRGEEVERKIDWIETPKGRVPTWESANEAFKDVENYLNELYSKLERIEERVASQETAAQGDLASELKSIRSELQILNERIALIEGLVTEVSERVEAIDYISEVLEQLTKQITKGSEG